MSDTASRLIEAREYLGLAIDHVVSESGLTTNALAEVERGMRAATDLELRRLSRVYGYPASFFRGEAPALDKAELEVVARWAEELTKSDQAEALRFAEYLRFAALGEADASS